LGLIFVELGLLLYGHNSLKHQFSSGIYSNITRDLDNFFKKKFPILDIPTVDEWNSRFQDLLQKMLKLAPENRPKASEVWEQLRELVEYLGVKPHCEEVSFVESIPFERDEEEDEMEVQLRENTLSCLLNKLFV
jgi:serine/threonine protein kinase